LTIVLNLAALKQSARTFLHKDYPFEILPHNPPGSLIYSNSEEASTLAEEITEKFPKSYRYIDRYSIERALCFILENLSQHEFKDNYHDIYMRIYESDRPVKGLRIEFWGAGNHTLSRLLKTHAWFSYKIRPWNDIFAPVTHGSGQHMGVSIMFDYLKGSNVLVGWRDAKIGEGPHEGGHIIALHLPYKGYPGLMEAAAKLKSVDDVIGNAATTGEKDGAMITKEIHNLIHKARTDEKPLRDESVYESNRQEWIKELKSAIEDTVNYSNGRVDFELEQDTWEHLFRGQDGSWWLHLHYFSPDFTLGMLYRIELSNEGKIIGLKEPMVENISHQILEYVALNYLFPRGESQHWFIQHGMSVLSPLVKAQLERFIAEKKNMDWKKDHLFLSRKLYYSTYPQNLAGKMAISPSKIDLRARFISIGSLIEKPESMYFVGGETGIVYEVGADMAMTRVGVESQGDGAMNVEETRHLLQNPTTRPSPISLSATDKNIIEAGIISLLGIGGKKVISNAEESVAFSELKHALPYLKKVVDEVIVQYWGRHIIVFGRDAEYLYDGLKMSLQSMSQADKVYLFPGSKGFMDEMVNIVETALYGKSVKEEIDERRAELIAKYFEIDIATLKRQYDFKTILSRFDRLLSQGKIKSLSKDVEAIDAFARSQRKKIDLNDPKIKAIKNFLGNYGITQETFDRREPFLLLDSGFKGSGPDKLNFVVENIFGSKLTDPQRQQHLADFDIKLVSVLQSDEPHIQRRQIINIPYTGFLADFPRIAEHIMDYPEIHTGNGIIATVLQMMPRYYGPSQFNLKNNSTGQLEVQVSWDNRDLQASHQIDLNHTANFSPSLIDPVSAMVFQKAVVDYFSGDAAMREVRSWEDAPEVDFLE